MDSIVNHTVRYYGVLDSLARHSTDYYTLQDSVINSMDSIVNHTVRYYAVLDSLARHTTDYYTLQDSVIQNMADIAAIEAGDDHIDNDTWFTADNYAGDSGNAWKVSEDNTFEIGFPWLLESRNSEADAGIIYRNVPFRNLNYGDSVGFRDRAGGFELMKLWGITDGSDGLASRGMTVNGTLLADNLSGTNTGDQDISGVAANLDSIQRHTTNYYTLQDSVINNMDSIVNHTVRYYSVLDSLIRHTLDYYTLQDSVGNNMDSIVAHTVRYYGVMDSLARHTVDYYTLQDSVVNSMDSIVNHTVRYYGILDSLIVHDGNYYSLRDSVINNMDSIVNHTVRYYGILDSLIVHNDNYYTLRDTVIQNMADIAAIEAGENDIDNDTWFTGDNYAGDSGNAWQVTKDNTIDFGYPLLLKSQNSADNIVWKNIILTGLELWRLGKVCLPGRRF
jgi:tRNA isopentenyl-2-thiomethyl-A-37 hydroxylase MiaE